MTLQPAADKNPNLPPTTYPRNTVIRMQFSNDQKHTPANPNHQPPLQPRTPSPNHQQHQTCNCNVTATTRLPYNAEPGRYGFTHEPGEPYFQNFEQYVQFAQFSPDSTSRSFSEAFSNLQLTQLPPLKPLPDPADAVEDSNSKQWWICPPVDTGFEGTFSASDDSPFFARYVKCRQGPSETRNC
jgi:hypothetical protein